MTEQFVIRGGRPLQGAIAVPGSKNGALYTVAAALLTSDEVTLRNVPAIADIAEMADILRSLGAEVEMRGDTVAIRASELTTTEPPADKVLALRASFLVMGPLLGRMGEAKCPPPGGDVIGARPLDVHLAGFQALGASIDRQGANWAATSPRLRGARIFFDYPSVLGTVNVVFAAVLAEGETTIINAAAEPEVAMVCRMLNEMGAHISGLGSSTLTIDGVSRLHGVEFEVETDRLVAGTYLLAGIATGGDVTITNAMPDQLDSLTAKLLEVGATVEAPSSGGLRAAGGQPLRAVQLQAVPYPGFATDLHAPMAAVLTQAEGVSLIHERVYDNRTLYVGELRKMGARITVGGQSVIIEGRTPLQGTLVRALDIRAGAAVVLAGLAAEGETDVSDIHHLDRGYADLCPALTALGAEIERC
jgi:UDP-N-acetylglucosamine 1-carboxyvinyltransferase